MQDRNQQGAVTAEAAVVLPTLALFALAMVWCISLGVTAIRAQDAAREAARVLARGDSTASATGLAEQVAPAGSRVAVRTDVQSITVTVTAPVRGPGGVLGFLPDIDVHADAVAATEGGTP